MKNTPRTLGINEWATLVKTKFVTNQSKKVYQICKVGHKNVIANLFHVLFGHLHKYI
jgi:hypothetical protein